MPRKRNIIPGVDPKLLIKDAAKLMPDPTRRCSCAARSLGALTLLTGCDIIDSDAAEGVLRKISQFNDRAQALAVQSERAGAGLSRKRDHPAVPVQRLLRRGRGAGGRRRDLQARGRRPGRQQGAVDARQALRAAAGVADHPPRLRRRLERDRLVAGRAAVANSSSASAPTPAPNTSGSSAPRAIPTPSTCRPRCIRRPS